MKYLCGGGVGTLPHQSQATTAKWPLSRGQSDINGSLGYNPSEQSPKHYKVMRKIRIFPGKSTAGMTEAFRREARHFGVNNNGRLMKRGVMRESDPEKFKNWHCQLSIPATDN
jgi:hypothetical protein